MNKMFADRERAGVDPGSRTPASNTRFPNVRGILKPEGRLMPPFSLSRYTTSPNPEKKKILSAFSDVRQVIRPEGRLHLHSVCRDLRPLQSWRRRRYYLLSPMSDRSSDLKGGYTSLQFVEIFDLSNPGGGEEIIRFLRRRCSPLRRKRVPEKGGSFHFTYSWPEKTAIVEPKGSI